MFKSLIVLSLSAALNLVLASSVTLTSPEPNDVWEAGSTVEIKWKVNEDTTGPIRLQYASGPSKSLIVNGVIADDVDASLGKYTWKIPSNFKAKKYVIEAGPNANDLSFAGYIRVENDKKTATTKKHTTTKKKTSTKKTTTKKQKSTKKHATTKKITTTKTGADGGKRVCVGYRENDVEKVSCHVVQQQNVKKTTKKTTKHKTTKHKTTKHKKTKKTKKTTTSKK